MATQKPVTTSLVIDFASNIRDSLVIEVDSRPFGLNGGRSEFFAGDSPAFLVYAPEGYRVTDIITTEGAVQGAGSGAETKEEWLSLPKARTASVRYPIAASTFQLLSRYGQDPGGILAEGTDIRVANTAVCVMRVRYQTLFTAYRVVGASGEAPVLVYVVAEAA